MLLNTDRGRRANKEAAIQRPVVFLHLSGISLLEAYDMETISRHQNRYTMKDMPQLRDIFEAYIAMLKERQAMKFREVPYGFDTFSDSAMISKGMRIYYAELVYYYLPTNGKDAFFQAVESPLAFLSLDPVVKVLYNQQVHPNPFCASLNDGTMGCSSTVQPPNKTFRSFLLGGPYRSTVVDMEGKVYFSEIEEVVWKNKPKAQIAYANPQGINYKAYREWFTKYREAEGNPIVDNIILEESQEMLGFHANNHWKFHVQVNSTKDLGVNLIGHHTGIFGVGKAAALYARAFQKAGLPTNVINMFTMDSAIHNHAHPGHGIQFTRSAAQPVNVCVVNADQTKLLLDRMSLAVWACKYNIGVWAWELDIFPKKWMKWLKLFDEIWTLSKFEAEALKNSDGYDGTPVKVLNIPFDDETATLRFSSSLKRRSTSNRLKELAVHIPQIQDSDFVFLVVFDFMSLMQRKNPQGAIRAFVDAFPLKSSGTFRRCWLLVKTINADKTPATRKQLQELKALAGNDPRIHFIGYHLSEDEFISLQTNVDCYVSLHRSEGYGMNILEMLAIGKPVIATNYSGNVDMFSALPENDIKSSCVFPIPWKHVILEESYGPYNKGNRWAEPDHKAAVVAMKEVASRNCQSSARKWSNAINSKFSLHAVGAQAKNHLLSSFDAIVYQQKQVDAGVEREWTGKGLGSRRKKAEPRNDPNRSAIKAKEDPEQEFNESPGEEETR